MSDQMISNNIKSPWRLTCLLSPSFLFVRSLLVVAVVCLIIRCLLFSSSLLVRCLPELWSSFVHGLLSSSFIPYCCCHRSSLFVAYRHHRLFVRCLVSLFVSFHRRCHRLVAVLVVVIVTVVCSVAFVFVLDTAKI